jgi:hypothetical protein
LNLSMITHDVGIVDGLRCIVVGVLYWIMRRCE